MTTDAETKSPTTQISAEVKSLLKKGDRTGALARLEKALERYPDSKGFLAQAAFLREEKGDRLTAIYYLEKIHHNAPHDATVMARLGQMYAMMNCILNAERMFSKAYREAPHNTYVLRRLGVFCAHQERHDEAVRFLREALSLEPHHIGNIRTLGYLYLDLGRMNEFEKLVADTIGYARNDPSYLRLVAKGALKRNDMKTARQMAFEALRIDPKERELSAVLIIAATGRDAATISELRAHFDWTTLEGILVRGGAMRGELTGQREPPPSRTRRGGKIANPLPVPPGR